MKPKKISGNPATGIGAGLATALMGMTVFTLLGAFLIHREMVSPDALSIAATIINFLSALIGAYLGCLIGGGKYLLVSGSISGLYFLLQLGLTAIAFGGNFGQFGASVLAIFLGAAVAVGILTGIQSSKTTKKRKYRR